MLQNFKKIDKKEKELYSKIEQVNNNLGKGQAVIAEKVNNVRSEIRAFYGIQTNELPDNMKYPEQLIYITRVLLNNQNKLSNTSDETPERVLQALQDKSEQISNKAVKHVQKKIIKRI